MFRCISLVDFSTWANRMPSHLHTNFVPYRDEATDLEGFFVYSETKKRPLVILCHAWKGRDEFICEKAKEIAAWGYASFALDMYGKGVLGATRAENAALKRPFMENRALLQQRVVKGFEIASHLPQVDAHRIAVIGLGFGGVCALDLARSGVDLKGAISIYGHFDPPPSSLRKPVQAKVLILHGYNDPVTPQEELRRFEREMEAAQVDWQVHLYGGTMHAFVTPSANDPQQGILYNSLSAARGWIAARNFLQEVLE